MNREQALYDFMSCFGIPAYAATATPAQAEMPYITYELTVGTWDNPASMSVNLWYRTDSEAIINAKAREIGYKLSGGGQVLYFEDEGGHTRALWITKGSPWCQAVTDEDNTVKRRYFNFECKDFAL